MRPSEAQASVASCLPPWARVWLPDSSLAHSIPGSLSPPVSRAASGQARGGGWAPEFSGPSSHLPEHRGPPALLPQPFLPCRWRSLSATELLEKPSLLMRACAPFCCGTQQHPGHWRLGLKLDAAGQRGTWTGHLCISWAVSLTVKRAGTMAFKALCQWGRPGSGLGRRGQLETGEGHKELLLIRS